jgi:hypothetical protein
VTDARFVWRVTVELDGWHRVRLVPGLRRELERDRSVRRFVRGWPLHMRLLRKTIGPHATIEVAAADQREAYRLAEAAFTDALGRLGVDVDPKPWTLSTDWERA